MKETQIDSLPETTLGEKLKKVRLKQHLTQKDFCNIIDVDRSYYVDIENDINIPSINIINQISLKLNMNPFYLYDDYMAFISNSPGGKIKCIREQKKLTQQKLANLLNVSRETIKCWENNKTILKRINYYNLVQLVEL